LCFSFFACAKVISVSASRFLLFCELANGGDDAEKDGVKAALEDEEDEEGIGAAAAVEVEGRLPLGP
jgi:hypothetical protein